MKIIGVIPARWSSSRFPGKPLREILGKAMIHRVWDQVNKCKNLTEVLIATDDQRIVEYCRSNNLSVIMTSSNHATGSDRIAEVAMKTAGDIFVNIQGDEPLIEPESIDTVTECLKSSIDRGIEVSTGYIKPATQGQCENSSVVHLVPSLDGCVITFSRYPVPHQFADAVPRTIHVGLNAFTRSALTLFSTLTRGPIERAESIEIMRFLEHGHRVACVQVKSGSVGVDTPEDLLAVESILENIK